LGLHGIAGGLQPGQQLTVRARRENGQEVTFQVTTRIDAPVEVDYYKAGGVLQTVLHRIRESNKS